MGKVGTGPANPNWRGGRTIDPRGYVLIRVGVGHHLADVRGYAYEHRLIAEEKLGRKLRKGEEIHHKRERDNNGSNDLVVCKTALHHKVHHRTSKQHWRAQQLPGEPNPFVSCECGCGTKFRKYDAVRRARRYVSGHNLRDL